MRTILSVASLSLLALGAGSGCKGPALPHPLANTEQYLCCNLRYEKPKINDVNYQRGILVPFGTKVTVLEIRRNWVRFQPEGHPPIELVYKHGAKVVPFEQFLERLFVSTNPRTKLRKVSAKTVKQIEDGIVTKGMTRDQVMMTLGIPPAHRTPSLEASQWMYWQDRWHEMIVSFSGDRVDGIGY